VSARLVQPPWRLTWASSYVAQRGGVAERIEHKHYENEADARAAFARIASAGVADWARLRNLEAVAP
jgi:hypothetical protein